MPPGRIAVRVTILLAILVAGLTLARQRTPASAPAASAHWNPDARDAHDALLSLTQHWIHDAALAREDGYVYAIDLTQLITALHRADDRTNARLLTDLTRRRLIRADPAERAPGRHGPAVGRPAARTPALARGPLTRAAPADPFTDGFVGWRYRDDQAPDASGTTEALRMIEALLEAGDPAARDLAIRIARGYARHGGVDHDIWIIRNYFNFGTRAFATNTYLVDYDPDLLAQLADTTGDPTIDDTARRSIALVRDAAAPCGLVYDIIQPEVVTLMPDGAIRAFSPNDIVQLANSVTIAERSVRPCPHLARDVLRFAVDQTRRHGPDDLPAFYLGRTGEAIGERRAGGETFAGLVRLAIHLDDREATELFAPALIRHARAFVDRPHEPRLYRAGEMLLGLQSLRRATPPNVSEH